MNNRLQDQDPSAIIASLKDDNASLRDRVRRLEIRLEMGNQDKEGPKSLRFDESADGIACRDETIRLQDRTIDRLRAKLDALTGAQGLALVFDNPEPDPLNRLMQWVDVWDDEHPGKNHPVAESLRTYAAAWRAERTARQAPEKDLKQTMAALKGKRHPISDEDPENDPLRRMMRYADRWSTESPDNTCPDKIHPITSALRIYANEWRTERVARQASEKDYEETIAALEKKVASLAPHETCACSYDRPEDMCLHHAPEIVRMREAVAALQARVMDLERDTKGGAP